MAFNPLDPIIREYDFNVSKALGFQGAPRNKLYLGVELELDIRGFEDWAVYDEEAPYDPGPFSSYACECNECYKLWEEDKKVYEDYQKGQNKPKRDSLSYVVETLPNFALMKKDGSIDGVEIVSAPASLRIHRSKWARFFRNIHSDFLVKKHNGFHVHISRGPLTVEQQHAFNEFVCEDENEEWMVKLAGRDFVHNNFCEKKKKSLQDIKDEAVDAWPGHHDAVCVSSKKTLEIRIFSATTKYREFMWRLEFVDALANFLIETKWSDEDLRVDNLRKYVKRLELRYPNLYTYMSKVK